MAADWRPQSSALAWVVVDERGQVFSRLMSLELPFALWRVVRPPHIARPGEALLVIASYDQPNWETITRCASRYPTLIVTTSPSIGDGLEALRRGAVGYVPLALSTDALARTLTARFRGELAFSRELLGAYFREQRSARLVSPIASLTPRQRDTLLLLARGATGRQIGVHLGLAEGTVNAHVRALLKQLNVPTRAAAVSLFLATSSASALRPIALQLSGDTGAASARPPI